MFKAFMLSTFIIAAVSLANHGYQLLLSQLDSIVIRSYGLLSNSPEPELHQAGKQVTAGYLSYRHPNN